jgi:hypothetical protein
LLVLQKPALSGAEGLGTTDAASLFIRHIPDVERCATPRWYPVKLRGHYGAGYLHFVTTSCYRRLPLVQKSHNPDLLLEVLERCAVGIASWSWAMWS